MSSAGQSLINSLSNTAKAEVESFGNSAKAEVESVGNSAKAEVESFGNSAKAEVESVGNSAKAEVESVADSAKAEVQSLADSAKADVKAVADSTKADAEAATSASNTAVQASNTALQGANTALQAEAEAVAAANSINKDALITVLAGEITTTVLNSSGIAELKREINDLQDQQQQDKPVKTSQITVQYFTGCDQDNNPTFGTKTVSVIEGTEEAETLKFQQAAIADGATCKNGNGNGLANILNEVRDIGASLINASEQTINVLGQGFNALQDDGVLSETNWKYFPSDVSLKSGILANLAAGNAADATSIVANQKTKSGTDLSQQINAEISTVDLTGRQKGLQCS